MLKRAVFFALIFCLTALPALAQSKHGWLFVISEEDEYHVYVDRVVVGETPIKRLQVEAGYHTLKIAGKRYFQTILEDLLIHLK